MIRRIEGVPSIRRLPVNTVGRDFFVTDVHGCFGVLQMALDRAGFDETKDRLIIGGDLVDRGPQNHLAVEWLKKPWVHSVRGNHDQMLLDAAANGSDYDHENSGGEWYAAMMKENPVLAEEFNQVFSGLPIALEIEARDGRTFGVVHAECPTFDWGTFAGDLESTDNPVRYNQVVTAAIWMRSRISDEDVTPVTGIDLIFVGHTPVNKPIQLGNTIFLDTGAVFKGGHISVMQMDTQEIWTATREQHRAEMWEKRFRTSPGHEI